LVEELSKQGVEVIAITDHHNVESSRSLFEAATAAGIVAFPAFEAESKDGIHVLCLFPPDTEFELIERRLAIVELSTLASTINATSVSMCCSRE